MQKGLCITALTMAVIVFAIFLADLVFGLMSMPNLAPFKNENLIINIVMVVCSLIVGVLSWFTYKEQV